MGNFNELETSPLITSSIIYIKDVPYYEYPTVDYNYLLNKKNQMIKLFKIILFLSLLVIAVFYKQLSAPENLFYGLSLVFTCFIGLYGWIVYLPPLNQEVRHETNRTNKKLPL